MNIEYIRLPQLLSINDLYKPTSKELYLPDKLPHNLMSEEQIKEKYERNYEAFNTNDFVNKCKSLINGINPSSGRKIDKTKGVYKDSCNDLWHMYGTNVRDYEMYLNDTSLHEITKDKYVSIKVRRYMYATSDKVRENEKFKKNVIECNEKIRIKNEKIEEENKKLYSEASELLVSKNKTIEKLREDAKKENENIRKLNVIMWDDCSTVIVYKEKEYKSGSKCRNKNCKNDNCEFKHVCIWVERTYQTNECSSCRNWFGCRSGSCGKNYICVECEICGSRKT